MFSLPGLFISRQHHNHHGGAADNAHEAGPGGGVFDHYDVFHTNSADCLVPEESHKSMYSNSHLFHSRSFTISWGVNKVKRNNLLVSKLIRLF